MESLRMLRGQRILPYTVVIFFILFRLVLTSDRDIVANNSPHDEYWYIQNALRWVLGGEYDQMAFMHLPIYSYWLLVLSLIGVPARLGVEIVWLASSAYLAYAVCKLTKKVWVSVALFAYLALHPYTLVVFDRALAESLLTVLSVSSIAAAIEIWNTRDVCSGWRRKFAAVFFSACFAAAYNTRKEGVALLAPIVFLGIISWHLRDTWWSPAGLRKFMLPLVFGPVLATVLLGLAIATTNFAKWGIFARYDLAATGYARAVGALSSIDLGSTPRQITITKQMLDVAYRESPTFAQLKPFMDGETGKAWDAIAAPYTPVPGEVANGWFYWALRDVAAAAGWHKSARDADRRYAAVAAELELAFASGRLKRRSGSISPFLDPDIEKWINEVPDSAKRFVSLLVSAPTGGLESPPENASADQFEQYVRLVGRRQLEPHTLQPRAVVQGWALVPPMTLVGLRKDGVIHSLRPVGEVPRKDVAGAYPFEITAFGIKKPYSIVARTPDGLEGFASDDQLVMGKVSQLNGTLNAALGIEKIKVLEGGYRADRIFSHIVIAYKMLSLALVFCVVAVFLYAIFRKNLGNYLLIIAGLLATLIVARVLLFAILDASSWSALQVRYFLPLVPVFGCMSALAFAFLLDELFHNRVRT